MWFLSKHATYSRSAVLVCLLALITSAFAQQREITPVPLDDVLRINTDLVQTTVVVTDRNGNFVGDLKPDQFELRVGGSPTPIAFFERVGARAIDGPKHPARRTEGRALVFFVDDRHLEAESLQQTSEVLLDFVETHMKPDDQIAIVSTSGQIGFLQQFSNHKSVLRAAISRLKPIPNMIPDTANPPMTEYIAFRIVQGDRDALTYYTNDMLRSVQFTYALPKYGGKGPGFLVGSESEQIQRIVMQRAQAIVTASAAKSTTTLSALETFLRSSSLIPGRKQVIFISDGFFMHDDKSFEREMQRVTDSATRSRAVIYPMSGRNIAKGSLGRVDRVDALGRTDKFSAGERMAAQAPLTMMATMTGGLTLFQSDSFTSVVNRAIQEEAHYYLLAWRPTSSKQKGENFRNIDVNIIGRSDVVVRAARGFLALEPNNLSAVAETKSTSQKTATRNLPLVSGGQRLETDLAVGFLEIPQQGSVLAISVQVAAGALGVDSDGKPAAIDIGGAVFNDQGKQAGSFRNRVQIDKPSQGDITVSGSNIIYNHKIPLGPGIYQVRVAARDEKNVRNGTAASWIEIPDLTKRSLTLSSLFIGGQVVASDRNNPSARPGSEQIQFSVDHRFRRGSHLNFLTIIYNAARDGNSKVDLEAVAEVLRDGEIVIKSPLLKVPIESGTDIKAIPYGADLRLGDLQPGAYVLRIQINDRVTNSRALQHTVFYID